MFGKYAIIQPVTHNLKLEEGWWWVINPPTSGDEVAMSRFLSNGRRELGPDGVIREFYPTNIEVVHREIALTFGGTNIPGEEGGLILSDNAKTEDVEKVLMTMPLEMVMELWAALGEAVPSWGPERPKESKSSENSKT